MAAGSTRPSYSRIAPDTPDTRSTATDHRERDRIVTNSGMAWCLLYGCGEDKPHLALGMECYGAAVIEVWKIGGCPCDHRDSVNLLPEQRQPTFVRQPLVEFFNATLLPQLRHNPGRENSLIDPSSGNLANRHGLVPLTRVFPPEQAKSCNVVVRMKPTLPGCARLAQYLTDEVL